MSALRLLRSTRAAYSSGTLRPGHSVLPIVSSTRDLELLEDPDLELIEMVDVLLELEGDQG